MCEVSSAAAVIRYWMPGQAAARHCLLWPLAANIWARGHEEMHFSRPRQSPPISEHKHPLTRALNLLTSNIISLSE